MHQWSAEITSKCMTNSEASLHFLLQKSIIYKTTNRVWLLKNGNENKKHHQEVTVMQKDLQLTKSLVQTFSEPNQEHLHQIKSVGIKVNVAQKKLKESGKMSQSMKNSTASEQSEVIHELRMKNISLDGSLNGKDKPLDKVTLSMDRSESQVMRLMQQIRVLQNTVDALEDAEQFKDPVANSSSRAVFRFACLLIPLQCTLKE